LIRVSRGTSWTQKFLEGEGNECWNKLQLKKKEEIKGKYDGADENPKIKLRMLKDYSFLLGFEN
jgi:hypothetical protein